MKYYLNQAPANPPARFLARILAALFASICLVGAFFFGLVILAVVAVLVAAAGLVLWLRSWWLGRRGGVRRAGSGQVPPHVAQPGDVRTGSTPRSTDFIEAEYTVVSERRD
jgi:hypothetical protein